MKSNLTILIVILSLGLVFSGCEKEGPQGPQGQQGERGNDGNANVISETITVSASQWTLQNNVYFANLFVPSIRHGIINGGGVFVFIESNTEPGIWFNMPYNAFFQGYFSTYNFAFAFENVTVYKIDDDLLAPSAPGLRRFRVLVVANSNLLRDGTTDWTNYKEIAEKFSLED
jgi:hypothetical protein